MEDNNDDPGGIKCDNWGCIIVSVAVIGGFIVWLAWVAI